MKILLLGSDGQLGWELQRALSPLGGLLALRRADADLEFPLIPLLRDAHPDVIVNAAAYTAVDRAESEPEKAMRVNAGAVREMAAIASELGALLVHYSTDYVFDGTKAGPYVEDDATGPLNTYGRTKLAGEDAVRDTRCRHLIFRTSWVFARRGRNFAHTILQRAQVQDRLQVVDDTFGVPSSAELIADVTALALHRLARDPAAASGTYHLVPSGETTWHGYAKFLVEEARTKGLPIRVTRENIDAVPAATFPAAAARPLNSRLANGRLCRDFDLHMPDWRDHVRRFVAEIAG